MDNKAYPAKRYINIGNDVWIGYYAKSMLGMMIGDGAIIRTNSTVIKVVEPYAIVGGNRAHEIKKGYDRPLL